MKLYNSMTRAIEDFKPIVPGRVTTYCCGPTVYDTPHLGNARPAVVFDLLFRLLSIDHQVAYAQNITDVDDKIIERATLNGESIASLTQRTTDQYFSTMKQLGCLKPTFSPRATDHIQDMIGMIGTLIDRGNAYVSDRNVMFRLSSFDQHGILSRHKQANLRAGSRVGAASYKDDQGDFVLWKPADGETGWDSPWGFGRPGWHIECSAMIKAILGDTIDIHGGGGDLRFPHHDCEISQSHCANDAPLANYWLHNGMVLVNGKKMAKSENNFTTVDAILSQGCSGEAIRLALLQTHYRSPLDWSEDAQTRATTTIDRWFGALLPFQAEVAVAPVADPSINYLLVPLYDDMNTASFFAGIHETVNVAVKTGSVEVAAMVVDALQFAGFFQGFREPLDLSDTERWLVDQRELARANRDFAQSDLYRSSLNMIGIGVKDTKDKTLLWRF